MRDSEITLGLEDPAGDDARWCVEQYFVELDQRFDDGFDAAIALTADAHLCTPPNGAFLVARRHGEPVGCGALKRTSEDVADIKRMWVAETARGQGLGRRILVALEDQARALNYTTVRLETNKNLREAIALYRSDGYREVDPFNDEPHAHHWFQKELTSQPD